MKNTYDIEARNNTETGNIKIRIFTHDTINENELERMKTMQFTKVQELVRNLYTGNVMRLE